VILLFYLIAFVVVLVAARVKLPRKPQLSRSQEITERMRALRLREAKRPKDGSLSI
jgi:hypothetical protein